MNFWDPESASCDTPQDDFDSERESTLVYNATGEETKEEDYTVGMFKDVFCKKNRIYYVAQVKQVKKIEPSKRGSKKATSSSSADVTASASSASVVPPKTKLLFHFLGWSSSFDEWIEVGSDRIAAHNLHTDPSSSDPRDQERWQAAHGKVLRDQCSPSLSSTFFLIIPPSPPPPFFLSSQQSPTSTLTITHHSPLPLPLPFTSRNDITSGVGGATSAAAEMLRKTYEKADLKKQKEAMKNTKRKQEHDQTMQEKGKRRRSSSSTSSRKKQTSGKANSTSAHAAGSKMVTMTTTDDDVNSDDGLWDECYK